MTEIIGTQNFISSSNPLDLKRTHKPFRPRLLFKIGYLRLVGFPLFPQDERFTPDTFEIISYFTGTGTIVPGSGLSSEIKRITDELKPLREKQVTSQVIELRFQHYEVEDIGHNSPQSNKKRK